MLTKEQVIEQMERHGALEIMAHFDTVAISGRAFCDAVAGTQGKKKMRAKFSHGIKAILLLEEYGETWEAEEAEEEDITEEQAEETTAEAEAAQRAEQAAEPPAEAGTVAEAAQIDKGSGRKSQHGEAVKRWRAEHPTGSKKGCARELGISLPTVRRHWQIDA